MLKTRHFESRPFFRVYMVLELVYHVPLSVWAIGALRRGKSTLTPNSGFIAWCSPPSPFQFCLDHTCSPTCICAQVEPGKADTFLLGKIFTRLGFHIPGLYRIPVKSCLHDDAMPGRDTHPRALPQMKSLLLPAVIVTINNFRLYFPSDLFSPSFHGDTNRAA